MPVRRSLRILGLVVIWATVVLGLVQAAWAQTVDPDVLQKGSQLFAENCAVCHGSNGQGRVGATLAKDWPSIRPELTVRSIIENGVPGSVMPAWSEKNGGPFSAGEIDALVIYILSWQTGGVPNLTPQPTVTSRPAISPVPNVEGDPNNGAVLFDQNCAVCHGENAQGRIGATLAKDWPSVRPDLAVKTTIENGVKGSVMPAWSKARGGPLGEQEINDLVAFILSLPAAAMDQSEVKAVGSEPFIPSWLAGWGGILLFLVLFATIIFGAIMIQRRRA